jgi:hypothetical protein
VNLRRMRTPPYIGHLVGITFFALLLLISVLTHVGFVFAQGQTIGGQFPQNIIVSSSTDPTPNSLKLLATQQEGAAVQEVSGFSLDIADNITAQPNSELLIFVSDSSVGVVGAKASTASGEIIDLLPSASQQAANSFSLATLQEGVYTLDIMTQKGNTRAAYEGILEISQQPPTTTAVVSPPSPIPSPSPMPAAPTVPSPSPPAEQSDGVGNEEEEDENGGADNDEGSNGEDDSGDEDENGEEDTGGDEGGGDEGGGDEGGGDEGGGDEGGGGT